MKLDSEQVQCLNSRDSAELADNNVTDNGNLKESVGVLKSVDAYCNLFDDQTKSDVIPLTSIHDLALNKTIVSNQNDEQFVASDCPTSHPVTPTSLDESICYVDKSVVEPELPETVVCSTEKTYQVVRDICVDDRVIMSPKRSLGDLFSLPPASGEDIISEPCESNDTSHLLSIQDLNSNLPSTNNPFLDHVPTSKNPFLDDISDSEDVNLASTVVATMSEGEEAKQKEEDMSSNFEQGSEAREPSDQVDALLCANLNTTESFGMDEDGKERTPSKSDQQPSKDTASVSEPQGDSEVRTGSISASILPALKSGDISQKRSENQVLSTMQTDFHEFSTHPPSHGERSSTVSGSLSGLITYSGPITHAGSLSVRSDSSTTSTRSFAFPILQQEWNSSPVRMAKAERKHHRRWRHGLLCCRF